ncbi:uncharacterized protein LOC135333909 isoform X2 [Halichondria panicea]|uniref:uncharacterized protein LOC135333909 isoform X2 n=1 Tax=Halichondria panicea TaxID=6063 RepID=UPI00312B40CB
MDESVPAPSTLIKDGWIIECSDYHVGCSQTFRIDELLYHEKSEFQDIVVIKNELFGTMLFLDGAIQLSERDECAYHESIVHLPLLSHPNPKSVLVVGGGDGGVLREVAKHSTVEEIHLCEIDEKVIEVSKKYLPMTAVGFSDPRVKVHIQDGNVFLEDNKGKFDVIITDSSDSSGLASVLFEKPYHQKMKEALKPGGIICSQADEVSWTEQQGRFSPPCITKLLEVCRTLFPVTATATSNVPTFPCGLCTFVMASTNKLGKLF